MKKEIFTLIIIFSILSLNFTSSRNLPYIRMGGEIVSDNEAILNIEFDKMGFILIGKENLDISSGKTVITIKKDYEKLKKDIYLGDRYGIGANVFIEIEDIKKPEEYMKPGEDVKTKFEFDTDSMVVNFNIDIEREPPIPMELVISSDNGEKRIPVEEHIKIKEKLHEGENTIYIATVVKPLNIEIAKIKILISIERLNLLRLRIGEKTLWKNGERIEMDTYPFIISGRTFVPIRFVSESLGGKVYWDKEERKVTVYLNNKKIEMWIDKNYAYVNGELMFIDPNNSEIKPFIKDDRTFVPLRFVSESLGMKVIWIGIFEEIFIFQ